MAILARSPKSRIFWKSAKGGRREIFEKSAKGMPSLKRPKSSLAQMSLSYKLYLLIMQKLKKILAQTAAPKLPEWPRYGDFRKVTQDPYFLKKCKGGTKENFSKIAKKRALDWKAQKHSGAANIILYLVCTWSANTEEDLGAKSGSTTARIAKLWQLSQGHPKPAFSEKKQRGPKRNFSKIVQKVAVS